MLGYVGLRWLMLGYFTTHGAKLMMGYVGLHWTTLDYVGLCLTSEFCLEDEKATMMAYAGLRWTTLAYAGLCVCVLRCLLSIVP